MYMVVTMWYAAHWELTSKRNSNSAILIPSIAIYKQYIVTSTISSDKNTCDVSLIRETCDCSWMRKITYYIKSVLSSKYTVC